MKKINKDRIKTWFVTGASSGVGKELCNQLIKRGYNVIAISRRKPEFEGLNALCLSVDITKKEQVQEAVRKGIEIFGKIDVLSNNAGISSYKTFEELSDDEIREVFETNYWGSYNTMKCLIEYFRMNRNGTIINNTSQSGLCPRAFGSAYCSSKYALEGLTSVLWLEAKNFCRVMLIELGVFKGTSIGAKSKKINSEITEYINLPWFYKKCKNNNHENNLELAINELINMVEQEKLPRRIIFGKDAMFKIKTEINSIKNNLIQSKKITKKCSVLKDPTTFSEKIFSLKNEYNEGIKRKVIIILGIKIKIK